MYSTTPFTWAYGMVLAAAVLPLACAWLAKKDGMGRRRSEGGFDNHHPREWLTRQQGMAARANAAQANSFEVLPFFVGAVIIAHQLHASQWAIDALAVTWVLLRVVYIACYLRDRATLRSVVWGIGFVVNVALLLIGAF